MQTMEEKILSRTAHIGVVGIGYVGLPLAVGFAKRGFKVSGIDVDTRKVDFINRGRSYIGDVSDEEVAPLVRAGKLSATTDYDVVRETDVIFICVPTPFDEMKTPDLSYVIAAARSIAPRLHRGHLVILQSTTYPGTTEEVVQPILENSGLKAGQDFYLAFSPERINPGDREHTVENTPKVVGGVTPYCTELAALVLAQLCPEVHKVSSPRVAEMSKLLENIYRSVNIALVNELALLCERMGIDFWEVIEAASTKPFGFMPFYPGPGVGGHCISVDPYYLLWKARQYDFYTKFIELAAEVNQSMPYHVVDLVSQALNFRGKTIKGAKILVLGVAFKKDVDDPRNSPAERVIELLLERGATVEYNDPYVPRFTVGNNVFRREKTVLNSRPLDEEILHWADCVVILAAHRPYDFRWITERASLIVDTVNATKGLGHNPKVFRLGAPIGNRR
ncbi:MAG TPA: nucleotide sugar dehydrogenase [Chloroflexi bacterium]|nr:nucleotide sugar dehydrogenase [Chloroflexota bacterium]